MAGLHTPVVFLVFNRPALTARVFARIREARPRTLIVAADGPRKDRASDHASCRQVRSLIEHGVDWPCEFVRDYAEENLGCGRRVSSGITRAFTAVEEAIILEDDCLPEPTFFPFLGELLEKYRDDPRIALVSGSHHQTESSAVGDSYYFCRYGNIWGWGTWRRAWAAFDLRMSDWPAWRDAGGMERLFAEPRVRAFWRRIWNEAAAGQHDTWDYQWTYSYMHRGMLGILPRVALVENIGFGEAATHTVTASPTHAPTAPMSFPLRHPAAVTPDFAAEARASARFFTERSFAIRAAGKIGRGLRRLFHHR